jgi:diaminopimelate epimerase
VACRLLQLCATEARVDLPGGPLSIAWDGEPGSSVWMSGPAVAVFDGLVTPELWGEEVVVADGSAATHADAAAAVAPVPTTVKVPTSERPAVDCATVCVNGCIQPDACPSAEARARAMALLERSSLDDLVTLASDSLESRTRARFVGGG